MKSPSNVSEIKSKLNSAIGFAAILNISDESVKQVRESISRALSHFNDLSSLTLTIGDTLVIIWGRGQLEDCYEILPDGSVFVLIGSPVGNSTWKDVTENIRDVPENQSYTLPWEGRVILLKFDAQNNKWTMWNDWLGSIPVFHVTTPKSRIASTLEPVVVDVSGFTSSDIHPVALLTLMMWGHYFSDWTLFKQMKVVPPDCEAIWGVSGFHYKQLNSVMPSDQRWSAGLDDLIDEMYQLSKAAIATALKENDRWILPLSSGLDSRLIAGVADELSTDVHTYTWGRPKTSDVIHSKSIARVLGFPWKYLNPGTKYLTANRERWADLFGSAMHFHGMYQMPFLDALHNELSGPILSGFIGECLAGYDTKFLCEVNSGPVPFQIAPDGYLHWTVDELRMLMRHPIRDQLNELAEEVNRLRKSISGALFQQLKFLVLWGRQRYFTYFQSTLSDYWRGVATPYMDREYAKFSFSLPRAMLDERVLQKMMLKRYYPKLASIPGTYALEPATPSGSYLIKKRIMRYLPHSISKSIFPGLYRTNPNIDVRCVFRDGKESFYPTFEKLEFLDEMLNIDVIEKNYREIVANNNGMAVRKLQSVQTLAYRLSG